MGRGGGGGGGGGGHLGPRILESAFVDMQFPPYIVSNIQETFYQKFYCLPLPLFY